MLTESIDLWDLDTTALTKIHANIYTLHVHQIKCLSITYTWSSWEKNKGLALANRSLNCSYTYPHTNSFSMVWHLKRLTERFPSTPLPGPSSSSLTSFNLPWKNTQVAMLHCTCHQQTVNTHWDKLSWQKLTNITYVNICGSTVLKSDTIPLHIYHIVVAQNFR